jgi:hypothetical protein
VVTAPVCAVPPPSFDPALLARPLRRGYEVERFNQLARRQAELTPAESDELYAYRLRRLTARERGLQRALISGSEEELRNAIAEQARRLAEVRGLEALRRQAGLPAGYEGDRELEVQAREQLAELARLRQRGLVAGQGQPLEMDERQVRLAQLEFRPGADDAPLYLVAPASLPAEALSAHVTEVAAAGAKLHLVRDAAEIPSDQTALVLNWGGNSEMPGHLVVLNQPEAVRTSSDQVESLRRLGDLAPRTVLNPEDATLLGSERLVAKRRQGARGANKRVLLTQSPAGELAGFDLYQEFLPRRREYRVSGFSGQVVSAYRKLPLSEAEAENLRPRWHFEPLQHLPGPVAEIARRGAERIGLDYAGVDVVEDLDGRRVLCLEANAAPGMSADTLRSLYATVQQVLRGTQEYGCQARPAGGERPRWGRWVASSRRRSGRRR